MSQSIQQLKQQMQLIRRYRHALGILDFDFSTIVPPAAREAEGDVIDWLSNELFKLTNSDQMKRLVLSLYAQRQDLTDPLDRRLVEKLYEEYRKTNNITPQLQLQMANTQSKAYSLWLQAKQAGDYTLFRDIFAQVVQMQRTAVQLRLQPLPDFYDNCLDDCEKGVLQADLDPFFAKLKSGLMDLLARIGQSKHSIRSDFLNRKVPVYKQEAFSRYLLQLNGYDFNKGVLATTEHPFTSDVAQNDARVTTHYYEDAVFSNIFSVIHEGGHAIFMQNEPQADYDHYINDSITNGMHESVSRFYENIIGRSRAYIHLIYPSFCEIFDEMRDVTEEQLYEAVNIVHPSLIRTEADEVTYGLHIVIRYEMEKGIASGAIGIGDVPAVWNALYKQYLGVDVPDDANGVLQDVHWVGGFGYFPSYALGNCYNAMYYQRMQREIPVQQWVREGNMAGVKQWLVDNVFAQANLLTPKQWLHQLTGQTLSPDAFLDYLNEKYTDIYRL